MNDAAGAREIEHRLRVLEREQERMVRLDTFEVIRASFAEDMREVKEELQSMRREQRDANRAMRNMVIGAISSAIVGMVMTLVNFVVGRLGAGT